MLRLALLVFLLLGVPPASSQDADWDGSQKEDKPLPRIQFQPSEPRGTGEEVFPEDGSLPMKAWYTSGQRHRAYSGLGEILEREGVALKDLGFDYEWIQDVALFSSQGDLILQADMPADPEILTNLTRGVLNDDCVPCLRRLTREDSRRLGIAARQMQWTFLEGGEMVTGRLSSGETYAILGDEVLKRTMAFHKQKTGREIGEASAKELVAADLGIKPSHLLSVRASGHLDLVMTALPGGRILLSSPAKTAEVLRDLLAKNPPAEEARRLGAMLALHERGHQRLYSSDAPPDLAGKPMGDPELPHRPAEVAELDAIEAALKGPLQVIRVPGVFKELDTYANSKSLYIADAINFFNGFVGSSQGGLFIATNGAGGLSSLEEYWRGVLSRHGVDPKRVHFPGRYRSGAGLDCAGAPSGK